MEFTDFHEPEEYSAFAFFVAEGVISACGPVLKQGKEACVYRCPTGETTDSREIAVKVYKNIEHRSFKAMSGYLQGRFMEAGISRRDTMHILSTPSVLQAFWVDSEFSVMQRLHDEGLPVPRPVAKGTTALAMEFIYADGTFEAAPRLRDFRCGREERREIKSTLLYAIKDMLNLDIIHGDLSPYNVLVSNGKPVIIDFPQAVDVRYNSRGQAMLERDILNICRYCPDPQISPEHEAAELTARLWDPIRMGPG